MTHKCKPWIFYVLHHSEFRKLEANDKVYGSNFWLFNIYNNYMKAGKDLALSIVMNST